MVILRFLNLVAGLAVLVAAGATFGAARRFELELLSHFTYPLLLLALASFGVALCIARRRPDAQIIVSGLALGACLFLTGPELAARFSPHSAPASEPRLTVMSYNVFYLNRTPERARDVVRSSGADVVVLIESSGDLRRIADGLTDIYPHRSLCPCGLFILSRWPIIDDYVRRDLRPGPQTVPSINWVVIDTPAGQVPVMGIHMQWPTVPRSQRSDQAYLLKEAARFDRGSLIVTGDFNSAPWSTFLRRQDQLFGMERRTRGLPTWPARLPWSERWASPLPVLPIDHVYAGGDWRTLSVRRGPSGGSDHYPVIVTLSRRSGR